MIRLRHPLDWPAAYRLWQAPFADRKLRPALAAIRPAPDLRVLDIGCGPGTNVRHFAHCEYLGIDLNEDYISMARRRYGDRFRVADASRLAELDVSGPWDCVLINSLLHHLDDTAVHALLSALPPLLSRGGRVHILELVLPKRLALSHALARLDRGMYPRTLDHWRALLEADLQLQHFAPYPLGIAGLEIWSMVHCVAAGRTA